MTIDNLETFEKVEINKIKYIYIYENIKSDYFLQKLFNNLVKKKLLDIIKYNNNIKKRLFININDYKEYSEEFSTIEIEIKLIHNKYGRFINVKREDEGYYHIYFNSNKEETKRNWIVENETIKIIKVIIDYPVKSFENLFDKCDCIESINFKKFVRNNIKNMNHMISECSSLKELNLYNFNTNNVTNMHSMFYGCSSLKELDLNSFNTNNVNNMSYMFYGCSSLKELGLNSFETNNVTDMSYMFCECSSLKELNLKNFKIIKVTDMALMFYGCSSLKELEFNTFNTYKETYMFGMFSNCSNELIMKIKNRYKNIKEEAFEKIY